MMNLRAVLFAHSNGNDFFCFDRKFSGNTAALAVEWTAMDPYPPDSLVEQIDE